MSFSPSTLTVESETTASSNLTATDASGIASGPTVTCTNGGSFDVGSNIFTAPAVVTANTSSVCTAVASDPSGNQGTGTLTVTVTPPPPPDTSAPVLSFSPEAITVASGQTATSTLTATDNVAVTSGPTVTCTNGGAYNVAMNLFTPAVVTSETESVCTATAGDAEGNVGTATLTVTQTPPPAAVAVTLSGTLTYDRVPLNPQTSGLNFNGTVEMPIRQAPVDLVNATGILLDSTVSDNNGDYSFVLDSGQNVRVRVRSEIQKDAPNEVDLQVVDNTSGDAVYAIQGELAVMPTTNQVRDLNAASGWGGFSYTSERAAAPFALLDTVFEAIEGFIVVDPDVDFPPFDVQWSILNRSETGNVDIGEIGSSSFTVEFRPGEGMVPVIRVVGDENNDTDEFDVHIVVHEFGHYFENNLSRSDAIGGPHGLNDRLDARTAFGEGWASALAGMILDDPVYRDSFGFRQSDGFNFDVENNVYPSSTGWFSEGSVQSILYDLYDATDDGPDRVTLGLGPIYEAFRDPDYSNAEAFTSIFSFLNALENRPGVNASEVRALTDAQLIFGSGQFGAGETNNGGLPDILPVYLNLPTNNTPVEFCSVDNFGDFNKHGNRRFFEFTTPSAGRYRITMNRVSGRAGTNPDFNVFNNGALAGFGNSNVTDSESAIVSLPVGRHVIDTFDFNNIGELLGASVTTGDACFAIRLEAL